MASSQELSALLSALGLTKPKPSNLFDIVVFSVFAYALGLAVSALARLFNIAAWYVVFPVLKLGNVDQAMNKAFTLHHIGNGDVGWNPLKATAILDRAHDHIKAKSSQERSLVIKLSAEVGLLYNLALAVSFAALLSTAWSPTLLFVLLLLLLAAVIRSARMWYRHASILAALEEPDGKKIESAR